MQTSHSEGFTDAIDSLNCERKICNYIKFKKNNNIPNNVWKKS